MHSDKVKFHSSPLEGIKGFVLEALCSYFCGRITNEEVEKKSKEDTWTTEELRKHVPAANPDVHYEDKRYKERKPNREDGSERMKESRARNKARELEQEKREEMEIYKADIDNERRRHRQKETEKDSHREKRKERDREKVRDPQHEKDLGKEKAHRAEREVEKELEWKTRQKDAYVELEDNPKTHMYKDREQHRRRETREMEDRNTRTDDRERRHRDRKEKEGSSREDSGSKDKYERSSEFKEKRDKSHKKMTEQELMLAGKERERRHRDGKEHENADGDKRRRHRLETSKEQETENKTRSFKDEILDTAAKNLEEKHKERRRGDSFSLGAGRERRIKENRESGPTKEYQGSKHNTKDSTQRRREKSSGRHVDASGKHGRPAEGAQKIPSKESLDGQQEQNGVRPQSAWSSIHRKTSDDDEEIDKEEILVDANHDALYQALASYEEDFEDYDDDFEDEEDEEDGGLDSELKKDVMSVYRTAEIEEIQRAISAENDMIATIPQTHIQKVYEREHSKESSDLQSKGPHRGVFIDFISAKQRQISRKMADKQKKRSTELLRLIDIDFSITFSLLDMAPVNEYDMYIRSFGKTNTKQAYVQCNEDYVDRDIQTDQVDNDEKWTQHPAEGAKVSGGSTTSDAEAVSLLKVDSQRLTNFLRSACQVVAVLLEEDHAERQSSKNVRSQEASLSIGDGCFQLNMNLPFLQDRKICCLHFSQVQRHAMLSVHGLPVNPGAVRLDNKYIICVWNIWEPSTPQKILVCDSEVKCCCFSPGKVTLVFAGTVDGSLAVWDLREDSNMHHCMTIGDSNWVFRSSTFSTDGILTSVTHKCPVQAIEPISSAVLKERSRGLASLTSEEEIPGLSFHIASLDENGYLGLWVVMEMQKVDLAGSESDLGLIPGGRVKLVHSSTINLSSSFFSKEIADLGVPQMLNIKFLPSDNNHFIVGTDIGQVCHGTRHGTRVPPKLYKPLQRSTRPIQVTAVDFSPFGEPVFLVGCSDGSIRLHLMSAEYPVMHWDDSTKGQPIVALQWSLTKSSVFFVLDGASSVYVWDLLESDLQPVAKDGFRTDRVITMAVLGEPEKSNGLSGLALAKDSGTLDVQYIKKKWATSQPEESSKLHSLLYEAL